MGARAWWWSREQGCVGGGGGALWSWFTQVPGLQAACTLSTLYFQPPTPTTPGPGHGPRCGHSVPSPLLLNMSSMDLVSHCPSGHTQNSLLPQGGVVSPFPAPPPNLRPPI